MGASRIAVWASATLPLLGGGSGAVASAPRSEARTTGGTVGEGRPSLREFARALPVGFEENRGQFDGSAAFRARAARYDAYVVPGGARFVVRGRTTAEMGIGRPSSSAQLRPTQGADEAVFLSFGATTSVGNVEADNPLPGRTHYFLGGRPAIRDCRLFGRATQREALAGVDLVWRMTRSGSIAFDLEIAAGVDPTSVRARWQGASSVQPDGQGGLVVTTATGQFRQSAPVITQDGPTRPIVISGSFEPDGTDGMRLAIGNFDRTRSIHVDPTIVFNTYVGGNRGELGVGIDVDANGSPVVVGYTGSTNFPTTPGLQPTFRGLSDTFVSKFAPDGQSLVFSTFLGGNMEDLGQGVAVDAAGAIFVVGHTQSNDFPTVSPAQSSRAGTYDIFVTKLSTDGGSIVYSTYLGGSVDDEGLAIDVDASGHAVICGHTSSTDFPTLAAWQSTHGAHAPAMDAIVARLSADGSSLIYSTYLGGGQSDSGLGVVSSPDGLATVVGWSGSNDFPLVNPLRGLAGSVDAFVTRLTPAGAVAASTFLGGNSTDIAWAVGRDDAGGIYVAGYTESTNFPTVAALRPSFGGGGFDGFVAKYAPDLSSLLYATYLGGAARDTAEALAVQPDGTACVAGSTASADFPQPAGGTEAPIGGSDIYLARLAADGSSIVSMDRFGGTSGEVCFGAAVDGAGACYLTGYTDSEDFGVVRPFQPVSAGPSDVYVVKISDPRVPQLRVPPTIVRACDPDANGAAIAFDVVVSGSLSSGAILRVRDEAAETAYFEAATVLGTTTIPAHTFLVGMTMLQVEVSVGANVLAHAAVAVQVNDVVGPVLTGCEPHVLELAGPMTAITASGLGLVAVDACDPAPGVVLSPSMLPLGVTEVTASATDRTGNESSCSFLVEVKDTTAPTFVVTPGDVRVACDPAGGAPVVFDVLASDLSGVVTVTCIDETGREVSPAGARFGVGTHAVECHAGDGSGNFALWEFEITVFDDIDPAVTCPADITVPADAGKSSTAVTFAVTVNDNCDLFVEPSCRAPWGTVVSGDRFPVGVTEVACEATDTAGNVGSCSFRIRVEDREPPTISAPTSLTLVTDCSGRPLTVTLGMIGVTVHDACDAAPVVVVAPTTISPGTTQVVVTARDADGNSSSRTIAVTLLKGGLRCDFERPVCDRVENVIRPGRTVPLRLRVYCGSRSVTDAKVTIDAIERLPDQRPSCGAELEDDDDADSLLPDGQLAMRLLGQTYHFNLSTKDWPTTRGARFRVSVRVRRVGHADTICSIDFRNR